jgi:hypothetical protein
MNLHHSDSGRKSKGYDSHDGNFYFRLSATPTTLIADRST